MTKIDDQYIFESLEKLDQLNINVNLDFDIKSDSIFNRGSITKKIKKKTFEKTGINSRKQKFNIRIRYIPAISVSILLIMISPVFSSSLVEQVKLLFYYAPGIGIIQKESSSDSFVLSNILSWNVGNESIQITGAKLDESGFSVYLKGNGKMPSLSDFNVIDSESKSYKFTSALISSSGEGWQAYLSSDNKKISLKPKITLKKDLEELKIEMKKSSNFTDIQELGLTTSSSDVEISAIITRDNSNIRISLIEKPDNSGSKIIQYGSTENPVIALDKNGNKLDYSKIKNNEFYLTGITDVGEITLIIPEILIEKTEYKDIKIDIPANGTLELNKKFELNGLPISIESVNRDNVNTISMAINTYFQEDSTNYLKYFIFHCKDEKLLDKSSFSLILDQTHTFVTMYKGIEVNPEKSSLEMVIDNIIIAKRGNWVYNINLTD